MPPAPLLSSASASSSQVQRLIRFLASDGRTYYGDAILPRGTTDLSLTKQARIISGDIFGGGNSNINNKSKNDRSSSSRTPVVTDRVADVARLLCPLAARDARTVRCLGLNYAKHAAESKMPPPEHPVLFYKPPTALAGPTDPIPVSRMAAQYPGLDYECELVVVIGRAVRNVSAEDALDAVWGYTVGNDVSHREWQIKRGGAGQWSLGKGFDGWAPIGPGIVAKELLPAGASGLRISTKVNGQLRQNESTADLIFGVAETIAFLSQGTTLLPGDLIFTGTPSGVALGMEHPKWLKDGDEVEIELEGVGTIRNTVKFEEGSRPKL